MLQSFFNRFFRPKASSLPTALEHPSPQKFWGMEYVERAPVPGGHTKYMLVDGEEPGTVVPFPGDNFKLTTPEHQEEIRQKIKNLGFVLKA